MYMFVQKVRTTWPRPIESGYQMCRIPRALLYVGDRTLILNILSISTLYIPLHINPILATLIPPDSSLSLVRVS
jgi:hypothetical protein